MEEAVFVIKRGLTDNAPRQLIINKEYIKFEDKDFTGDTFTIFNHNEITDYKFGIKWIQLKLTLVRHYKIEIRNSEKKILKLHFKSWLGYKVKQQHQLYIDIFDAL